MAVFLGLLVAASFGSGDFFGGLASRRVGTLSVLALVQVCALVGAVIYSVVLGGNATGGDFLLGGGAGALSVVALGLLYAGLATGRMGIVAPITAVVAACIPVVWGLSNGESLSTVAFVGIVIAIVSAGLIARERDTKAEASTKRALTLAVGAGFLFGWAFVLYSETGEDSGAWPVLSGRIVAVALVLTVVAVRHVSMRLETRERRMAMFAGLLDVTATALLLIAVREGLTAVVAPVAALGPAFTVVWAWAVLREPIGRLQLVGLVTAIAGLVMIASG